MFPRALIPCQYIGLREEREKQCSADGQGWSILGSINPLKTNIPWREILNMCRISTNALSWHKPALQQHLSEGGPPFPSCLLLPGPELLLSPCWHPTVVQWTRPGNSARLKLNNFLFPRLVSTWMSSLIWFSAGPHKHLCWHKAGSSRGSGEECGLVVRGRKNHFL